MGLKIFNTMTGEKEDFKPLNEGKVGMYVCGVTVYDLCHMGHARATIVFDIIFRYLSHSGYTVNYIKNFTDVDDKIIDKAKRDGKTAKEVAELYIKEFYEDMSALGIKNPSVEPKATEHIDEMIALIKELEGKGLAYYSKGDVLFPVKAFDGYGLLSKKKMDDLIAGARVEVGDNKRDPLDFVLWKGSKPGEPMWDSPWGKGRPGWHIECSAMGLKYLGKTFDIHGGGRDLIFPHHENERAQSFGANGVEPVKYWLHNGFVTINQEKMSKSLNNFFTIRDILKEYDPEVIRYFLLSSHYRSPIDFSDQSLKDSKTSLDRFYNLIMFGNRVGDLPDKYCEDLYGKFRKSMDDDFNTAAVIGHLNIEMRYLNGLREEVVSKDNDIVCKFLQRISSLKRVGEVLGLFEQDPVEYFEKEKIKRLAALGITKSYIEQKINERLIARKERRWQDADMIRDDLASKGITLLDSADKTEWKI